MLFVIVFLHMVLMFTNFGHLNVIIVVVEGDYVMDNAHSSAYVLRVFT